ncbi:hypothetical protein HHJ78_04450 [Mobiluncus mulieris]|uniref:Uncharacterized protein n=1 Tax=Mobiluncus mulieris TaxID=2052 RepID=A0A7Y0U0Z2_9ACTO|nr:hypothetical protein [Mobiluncus mulieris]NMW64797.1 hypothetical protein [Mobiluncus mulieris]
MGFFKRAVKNKGFGIVAFRSDSVAEPYTKTEYQRPKSAIPVITEQTPRLSRARNNAWIKPINVWEWDENSKRAALALGCADLSNGKSAPCEVALWKEGHGLPIWVIAAGVVVGELPDDGRVRDKLKRAGSDVGIAQAEIRHRTSGQMNAGDVEYGWRIHV